MSSRHAGLLAPWGNMVVLPARPNFAQNLISTFIVYILVSWATAVVIGLGVGNEAAFWRVFWPASLLSGTVYCLGSAPGFVLLRQGDTIHPDGLSRWSDLCSSHRRGACGPVALRLTPFHRSQRKTAGPQVGGRRCELNHDQAVISRHRSHCHSHRHRSRTDRS